jgi:tRNA:m4X modification enzyme
MHLLDDDDERSMERNISAVVVKSKRPRGGLTTDRVGRRMAFRGKRVPCPIDPSHFIFEGDIPKHVLICPAVKCQQELAGKEYYRKGINLGGFGEMERRVGDLASLDDDNNRNESSYSELDEVKKLAYAVLRVFHHLFLAKNNGKSNAALSIEQLQNITESEIYNALIEADLSGEEEVIGKLTPNLSAAEVQSKETSLPGRLTSTIAKHNINAGGPRHLRQIASILGHARCKGLISTKKTEEGDNEEINPLIIEVGAGRGMTGLIVAGAMAASLNVTNSSSSRVNLCLIEKSGTRRKAERKTRSADGYSAEDCLRLDMVDIKRVKADLADIDMPKALETQLGSLVYSKTVVIAKHLCGAGTDLALMSMRHLDLVDGCVMATCCHGLCTWNEYVGRNCLLELFHGEKTGGLTTFGNDQFNVLKRWSSAAVSVARKPALANNSIMGDDDNDDMKETHYVDKADDGKGQNIFALSIELGLSCGGKGLGRAVQRIIDYGRCDYLKGRGFKVNMVHYVPPDVTPQNALIVATRIQVVSS